jgi:hypothetical protein
MDSEVIIKLTKDLKKCAETMTRTEARYLVDAYYSMQENRIRTASQIRANSEEPHSVLKWMEENNSGLENQIKSALAFFAESQPIGQWSLKVTGIGPVISAALIAHIDIEKAITLGDVWRFAGQDPTCKWNKGEKRPWNAALKCVCWKIGESFVKVHNNPASVYGKIYEDRKRLEEANNEAGKFADQAAEIVKAKRFGKDTKAITFYKVGKLPPGHIHARAKRYAVKMFLSHWWEQAWWYRFGVEPAKPFIFTQPGHQHYVEPEVPIEKQKA